MRFNFSASVSGVIAITPAGNVTPYVASAVNLDGNVYFDIEDLLGTDNGFLGFSGWVRPTNYSMLWIADPDNLYVTRVQAVDFGNGGGTSFGFAGCDTTDANEYGVTYPNQGNSLPYVDGQYHHIACALDTQHGPGLKLSDFRYDGVRITGGDPADAGSPFNIAMSGRRLVIGSDSYSNIFAGDIADVRIARQNWLSGGVISDATLALFRDPVTGKPVDPAIATAALGTPAVLLSGDSTSFGNNQGNGGPVVTHGTPTNASGSPSD